MPPFAPSRFARGSWPPNRRIIGHSLITNSVELSEVGKTLMEDEPVEGGRSCSKPMALLDVVGFVTEKGWPKEA